MQNLNPQQYHQRVISEIQQVLPLLEQTVASFNLTNPQEAKAYQDMIQRLRQGLSVDWSKFHAIHSAVKPAKPKQTTIPGYEDGVVSVPGPKGAGDVMPAMLSPGEAVIPTKMAKKYAPLINAMITGTIPGYEDGLVRPTQARLQTEFGVRGQTQLDASHLTSAVPSKALATLRNALILLGDEVEDVTVQVVEYTVKQDANGKETREATASLMKLSEVAERFGDGYGMVTGGYTFAGSAILEPSVRNRKGYAAMGKVMTDEQKQVNGEIGAPETLQDVVFHGDLAAKALKQFEGKLTKEVQIVLENIVREGQVAAEALESSASEQKELDFVIKQRKKAFENKIAADTGLETEQARNAKREELDAKIASIEEAYHRERSQGVSQEQALAKAKARLVVLANEEARLAKEEIQTMHVGKTGETSTNVLREGLRKTSRKPLTSTNEAIPHMVGRTTTDTAAAMVIDELGLGAMVQGAEISKVVRDAVITIFDRLTDGIIDTVRDYGEMASPSRKTERVGEDLVDGVEVGLRSGQDDAQQAGQMIGETISDAALGTVGAGGAVKVGRRRVTTDPAAIAAFRESEGGNQSASSGRVRRRSTRESTSLGPGFVGSVDPATGEFVASVKAVTKENENMTKTTQSATDKLNKLNSVVMNGTFALTSLAGVGIMAGGAIGQVSQMIFQYSGAVFALMQITQLLTQTKMLELIQRRALISGLAIQNVQTKAAMVNSAAFSGGLLNLGKMFLRFLGPIGILVSVVTIAGAAFAVFQKNQEEQRKKITGLGDTAFLTAEKMKKAGELLGFTAKTTSFGENIKAGTAAARGSEEASMISELRSSESFKTDFSGEIDAIRNATDAQAEAVLASVSNQLFAAGASKDQVDAYVRAIAQEAEKTTLNFSFANIDFAKDGAAQISSGAQEAADTFSKAFTEGITFETTSDWVPDTESFNPFDGDWVRTQTTNISKISDEARAAASTFAKTTAASFQSLKDGLANGIISADDFNIGLEGVMQSLNGLNADQLGLVLPDLYKSLGVEDAMDKIPNVKDQLLLLQADAAGITLDEGQIKALQNANKKDVDSQKAANRVRDQIINKVKLQAKEQEKLNQKKEEDLLINEKISGAAVSLVERNIQLEEQSTAYDLLIEKGYSAGDAFKYAGDAGLAAGLAAAAGIAEATGEVDELNRILDLIEKNKIAEANAPKSPGGGGGDKSPYQESIDSLKEQRKEILQSNAAFAKLRKAGFDIASAMKAAEDPILAAALATTKVGTKQWNNLIGRIKETQRLLSKKEMQDLLRGGKVQIAEKRAQATVANALTTLGYTAEQIDEVLSNQEFTNTLAKDLKDGKIDAKEAFQVLSQIKQLGNLDIEIAFATKEGAAEEFQKRYDKVVGYLEAQKQTIQVDFEVKTFDDSVIARKAEEDIALRQNAIDDYEAELVGIDEQEEEINKTYEERKKALDKISKSNEDISRQQKSQLTLADALSQGDIAAAARAAQEMRAQNADAQINKQGELLELSKEKALANVRTKDGRSRKQIEEDIKKLKKEIFDIEENRLEPARENIRLAEVEKNDKLDSINQQILRWDVLSARVNEAKLKLTPEEMSAMEYQAGLIADLLENWNKIEDKQAILTIIKKTIGEATGDTGDGGSGGGGTTSSSTTTSSTTDGNGGSGKDDNKDDKKDITDAQKSATAFEKSGMSISGFIKKQDSAIIDSTLKTKANLEKAGSLIGKTSSSAGEANRFSNLLAASKVTSNNLAKAGSLANNTSSSAGEANKFANLLQKAISTPTAASALGLGTKSPINSVPASLTKPTTASILQAKGIKLARGGMVKYMADGGLFSSLGTDIVPSMLTPGEFVVRRNAVNNFGVDNLKAINSGTYNGDSVYNYEVNVNVQTNSDPNQIATAVIGKIRQIESQKIRGNRF
jgi:hypothetical protein